MSHNATQPGSNVATPPSEALNLRRKTLKFLAKVALLSLSEFRVEGQENLPQSGPLILVSNHFHFGDPAVVIHVAPWPVEFIGDATTPNSPIFIGWIRHLWGYIRINRGGASLQGLRQATEMIRRGAVLYVAPEAGSWAPVLRPPRFGVSFLAAQSGAQLLPLGFDGLNKIFPCLRRGRRARVTIRIGRSFGPYKVNGRGRERRRQLNQIGREIMQRIAELIPDEKRGIYSSDPAVRAAAQRVSAFPWDMSEAGN